MSLPRAELVLFALASTALCLMAAGGGGWLEDSSRAAAAYQLAGSHAPGHSLLGKLATFVPLGEIAFRVALLSAVSMAAALAGTVALARALVPSEGIAAAAAAGLAALSPVLQVNGTRSQVYGPTAALLVWAMVHVVRHLRTSDAARRCREPLLAALLWGAAVTMHPIIAAAAGMPMAVTLARTTRLRVGLVALGCALLPMLAYGYTLLRGETTLPLDLATLRVDGLAGRFAGLALMSGEGLGLGILLSGLLGLCFGAVSGLRGAGVVLAAVASVLCAAALHGSFDPNAAGWITPALLFLAAGIAPMVGAVLRMLPGEIAPRARALCSAAVLLPIVAIGLAGSVVTVTGSGFRRGDSSTRWVADTVGQMPPGPGIYIVGTRYTVHPLRYERAVAGHRPDVQIVLGPELAAETLISQKLAAGQIVAGDDPFGHARPLGLGYLYGGAQSWQRAQLPALPPLTIDGDISRRVIGRARLVRARYLSALGRRREAIAVAQLEDHFTTEELATVDAAGATPPRAPWLDRVPRRTHVFIWAAWQSRLWADDLAWTAGFDREAATIPVVHERRVHWWWRRLERGLPVPDAQRVPGFAAPPRPPK